MLTLRQSKLPKASERTVSNVRRMTTEMRKFVQADFVTEHMIHGGCYYRTVILPSDMLVTSVLFKKATGLIVAGAIEVYTGESENMFLTGYNVIPGSRGRKIAFITRSIVGMTMVFATSAKTVDEVQREFTDEIELLPPLSKKKAHHFVITGE